MESIYLEVYDERNFTQDERIAWSTINIPFETLLKGEAIHDWYPLSGEAFYSLRKRGAVYTLIQ